LYAPSSEPMYTLSRPLDVLPENRVFFEFNQKYSVEIPTCMKSLVLGLLGLVSVRADECREFCKTVPGCITKGSFCKTDQHVCFGLYWKNEHEMCLIAPLLDLLVVGCHRNRRKGSP
jgi:hypothetical protein